MSQLGAWVHNAWLEDLQGKATVVATINATTAKPHVLASVDIVNPGVKHLQFDSFSTIVSLDEDGLWLGRWVKVNNANDLQTAMNSDTQGAHSIVIGDRMIAPDAGAMLQFKGAAQAPIEPLTIIGHLPFSTDAPIFFALRLPKQGLDIIKSYLPQPPATAQLAKAPPSCGPLFCAFP